jgi:ApaG protein
MENNELYQVQVKAIPFYLAQESEPENFKFVFAYTINIHNIGTKAARLLTRHWIITDGNGHIEEVKGEGVIGQQPYLRPGEHYQYTSYTIIQTPVGSMRGSYQMIDDDGVVFEAMIPIFRLALPKIVN